MQLKPNTVSQNIKIMWTRLLFTLFVSVAFARQDNCGEKPAQKPWDQYITAGRDAEDGAWPWQLSLQYLGDDGTWSHTCGAVLIEEDWAVTAAHCTDGRADPARFRIIAGGHNVKELSGDEQIIPIDLIINHNWYIPFPPAGIPNDIGLLRFSELADISRDDVGTACVPDESVGDFANGTADCWISGWGVTFYNHADIPDILQEASIPVPTNLQCRVWYSLVLRQSHICAGTGTPAACRGDSGGPMSCLKDGKWYVAGVTSFGPFFCFLFPSVYTRISSYNDWIYENINANSRTYLP